MFDEKEVTLMKKIGLDFNFSSLADDEFVKIEDAVGGYYTRKAQGTNKATEEILLCEAILDKL